MSYLFVWLNGNSEEKACNNLRSYCWYLRVSDLEGLVSYYKATVPRWGNALSRYLQLKTTDKIAGCVCRAVQSNMRMWAYLFKQSRQL